MNPLERRMADQATRVFTAKATVKTQHLFVCEGDAVCVCPVRWSPARGHHVHACHHGVYGHDHPAIAGAAL